MYATQVCDSFGTATGVIFENDFVSFHSVCETRGVSQWLLKCCLPRSYEKCFDETQVPPSETKHPYLSKLPAPHFLKTGAASVARKGWRSHGMPFASDTRNTLKEKAATQAAAWYMH